MSDWPSPRTSPPLISTYSRFCHAAVAGRARGIMAAPASGTYPSANLAIYVPFYLPWPYTLQGGGWVNGSSVTGTADFGVYSAAGARLISTGSVSRSGASAPQLIDFSGTIVLPPGLYYMAMSASSGAANTNWQNASVTSATGKMLGILQQATAHPLPATMSPAAWASTGYPLMGLYRT